VRWNALRVAAVARRQAAWREAANPLRRAIKTALDDHANENGLPRDYADGFFPAARSPKKPRVKAGSAPGATTPLSPHEQVLALPDPILRALAEDFVAALPANVQSIVRARRTG
jgi:hypothetical protein